MSFFYNLTSSISKTFSVTSKDVDIYNTLSTTEDKNKTRKSKTVSFGDTEIIEVESYKLYNQLDELSLEDIERHHIRCCGNHCKCEIF